MTYPKIILEGEPLSTSHIYKYHCRSGFPSGYMSNEGRELKMDYQKQLIQQWKTKAIKEEVDLNVKLFFKTKRKRDIDNFSKILFDAMSGIVFDDDNQIKKLTIEMFYRKDFGGAEITINKYEKHT
jgi:crossover junction endodeoxyribonuclease RusA